MSLFYTHCFRHSCCAPGLLYISNKGKPDPGNTSTVISNSDTGSRFKLHPSEDETGVFIEISAVKLTLGLKKIRLVKLALTRSEAKSMSTRLLAGESFAIFQIKAELFFLSFFSAFPCSEKPPPEDSGGRRTQRPWGSPQGSARLARQLTLSSCPTVCLYSMLRWQRRRRQLHSRYWAPSHWLARARSHRPGTRIRLGPSQ